jgi:hypothetical protein
MNLPMNHKPLNPVEDRLLDRLVDGELGEVERRELLLRLENEPGGWRRCALAFLEAQSWREAIRPLALSARTAAQPVMLSARPCRNRGSWRRAARLTALVASLTAACLLGWTLRGGRLETMASPPVDQGTASAPPTPLEPSRSASPKVATRESGALNQEQSLAGFDSMVKHWEQRGYRAETQKRMVSIETTDGEALEVPVNEIRLRYVGGHIY